MLLTLEEAMPTICGQARRFMDEHHPSLELDDLIQEGRLVYFSRCVPQYDPDRGAKFRTFLSRCLWNHFLEIKRLESRAPRTESIEQMVEDKNPVVERMKASPRLNVKGLQFFPALSKQARRFLDISLSGEYKDNGRKQTKTLVAETLGMTYRQVEQVKAEIMEKVILPER